MIILYNPTGNAKFKIAVTQTEVTIYGHVDMVATPHFRFTGLSIVGIIRQTKLYYHPTRRTKSKMVAAKSEVYRFLGLCKFWLAYELRDSF